MAKDVPGYLAEQQRKCSGELAQEWATLEEYYTKRYAFQSKAKLDDSSIEKWHDSSESSNPWNIAHLNRDEFLFA